MLQDVALQPCTYRQHKADSVDYCLVLSAPLKLREKSRGESMGRNWVGKNGLNLIKAH